MSHRPCFAALLCAAAVALLALVSPEARAQFDHTHAAWTALLQKHVRVAPDGNSSRVDYKSFAADRAQLQAYLKSLSAVGADEYAKWSKPQQYAFLANAYNAFTVEKILTRYPNLKSIRDFGLVFGNPWKDRFFTLLGRPQHLDGIEHETMRAPGVFDDPRVHVAVNCASIGCPMLGRQAFTADRLDAQLEDLMRRFLSDRTRNRYDPQTKTLELSQLFDWYADDFKKGGKSFLGYPGFASLADLGARYADVLADTDADRTALRAKGAPIRFVEYDWSLNDAK
ncbi:MAG: DUF547 domain-containing protein [Betaproteobacteria bacterium]|nr:MAG: DUF547 domain-containing protein [Betaproteobacteria bacterium]